MEKAFWQSIVENNYALPEGHDLVDLTNELLGYLGSTDFELRDSFAYSILARWMLIYGHYNADGLREIMEWLIPNMSEGLGEQDTDSVFLRSYSTLVLSLIMYRDNQMNFLTESEARSLLDKARHYLVAEQDLRGYVPDKGWANACAHTADLLKFLARTGHLEMSDLQRLLDAITDKLTTDTTHLYVHDEDDRLAQATMAVLRRDVITVIELSAWLKRFQDWKTIQPAYADFNPAYHATYQNIKNYLRSLYCQIRSATHVPMEAIDFQPELLRAIQVFSL